MLNKTCFNSRERGVLAAILLAEPQARKCFNDLIAMGAINFRAGYFEFDYRWQTAMYSTTMFATDPGCWYCEIPTQYLKMAMTRDKEGEWKVWAVERLDAPYKGWKTRKKATGE